jgi:aminoglycoside phosphotransferase (APT) family kinase protein
MVEGIHEENVTLWLVEHLEAITPPLKFSLIAGGHSNLTYRIDDAEGRAYVLRRPPLGHVLESAHDMSREHRIISALADTDVPVAPTFGLCQDKDVNDVDFYIMGYCEGTVLHGAEQAQTLTLEERQSFSRHMIEVLVNLHRIDPDDVNLGTLGRKEAYLARQLKRWTKQWEATKTHEIPEMDESRRLLEDMPQQIGASIAHGDYRPGNMMVRDGRMAAVFDWELCTLGDPLADVGYLLNMWHEPGEVDASTELAPIAIGGFASRNELCEWYTEGSGRDLSGINYYRAFSHWRLAAITQGVYKRYLVGAMGDQEFDLESYKEGISRRAAAALELLTA